MFWLGPIFLLIAKKEIKKFFEGIGTFVSFYANEREVVVADLCRLNEIKIKFHGLEDRYGVNKKELDEIETLKNVFSSKHKESETHLRA